MIAKETKERLLGMGVEHRVDKQAVEKQPIKTREEVKEMLGQEHSTMELLLVCEVKEWEQLFWNKFKAFLDQIDNDRVAEKERLTREWKLNCWKRLNTQRDAALKRMADFEVKDWELESLHDEWASCIRQFFEGVGNPDGITLRRWIRDKDRMQIEIEDAEFRLKRGSELGRFDQFWDNVLFDCRYSRSKWLDFWQDSTVPLEVYSHALKGNKKITHISFYNMDSDFDVNRFLCDLPWVTSIYPDRSATKLDPPSTYIFSDAGQYDVYSNKLVNNARVLISFVAPNSGKRLILRLKHSGGEEDPPLEVTLGSTKIQLNPSSKSSLTIDDITLYPIEVSGPSESVRPSFEPEVRNNIHIEFIGTGQQHGHYLHDIELLDENGLK